MAGAARSPFTPLDLENPLYYYYTIIKGGQEMVQFRMIEIDFDVHKRIENERRGFDEPPNAVLRRLLGLGEPPSSTAASHPKSRPSRSWSDKGVILQDGTATRMNYNNRTYEGKIMEGKWVIGDKAFDSPSAAAGGVAITKGGKSTLLNGWIYWYVRRPGDDNWALLKDLRPLRDPTLEPL